MCLIALALHTFSSSMLESVANLKKKAKTGQTTGSKAFQQLFLLVGMHLFKVQHHDTMNNTAPLSCSE